MDQKFTKGLSAFLTVVVVFLSVCDVLVTATAPWWLREVYSGRFGDYRVLLGYDFSHRGIIYPLMLTFFMLSGLLCLGILAAAYRILRKIRRGLPFCIENSVSQRNAGLCAFGLAGVFFAKMFVTPTFLTLVCIGLFLLFGLFMLVISSLFRLATRIKEENDLTI